MEWDEYKINAHWIVKRLQNRTHTYDDCMQLAYLGFLTAKRTYKTGKSSFKTYASLRINGYIKDYFRAQDFVPRLARKRGVVVRYQSIKDEHQKFDLTGLKIGEYLYGLTKLEKLVMTLYYEAGITMAEIGKVIGISESRISQIHQSVIIRLRKRFLKREAA
jgi:RNA polymerase sigma factor (sigma-70 family)